MATTYIRITPSNDFFYTFEFNSARPQDGDTVWSPEKGLINHKPSMHVNASVYDADGNIVLTGIANLPAWVYDKLKKDHEAMRAFAQDGWIQRFICNDRNGFLLVPFRVS